MSSSPEAQAPRIKPPEACATWIALDPQGFVIAAQLEGHGGEAALKAQFANRPEVRLERRTDHRAVCAELRRALEAR